MQHTTIVLPTARAIRHAQLLHDTQTLFLPNYITMGDFISKLTLVDGFVSVDEDTRTLLLLEASNFANFQKLQIERNFFTFTKNSSYIFKFFSELSAEMYDIENLAGADIYGEYEEHIEILYELYTRYKALCMKKKVLDTIFLPEIYTFNESYVKTHKKITIHIDGYLTNFEYALLEEAKNYCELELVFVASRFNKKLQERFEALSFELDTRYTISLNTMIILQSEKVVKNTKIVCESFSESLLQVAFVKEKIYEFIDQGYEPEKIAVVLPNETMAEHLRCFDIKNNLNFAMGESFTNASIYTAILAATKVIDEKSQESFARLNRIGDAIFMQLSPIYKQKVSETNILEILEGFSELIELKSEKKIYEKELYAFKKLADIMQDMSVKSLLNIFLSRLASESFDDVRGGKITVMWVLETRSVAFDGVIIVAFDDKHVPKRSDKDMFLNSQVRRAASLPTSKDRENLQKHYYEMLINSAKEVVISFVKSEQSGASRFLKQLGIKEDNRYDEKEYAALLFEHKKNKQKEDDEIVLPYSFEGITLSNSRLKTFLECKRKYFYRYIKSLKNHEIPKDMPQEHEIGTAVHNALKNLYLKKNRYDDVGELRADLHKELDNVRGESELDRYLIALQKRKLDDFCEREIEHFQDGWEVIHCEEPFEVEFCGMQLYGQIDRVDKKENAIRVYDYKTGSYTLYNKNNFTEATDFQLEFYYLLTSSLGNVECAFYDLKDNEIVFESFMQEKLGVLRSHIEDLKKIEEVNFTLCEDTKQCRYCEYALMCGREQ